MYLTHKLFCAILFRVCRSPAPTSCVFPWPNPYSPSPILFPFKRLRTHLHNGRLTTLCPSITSTLFHRDGGGTLYPERSRRATAPKSLRLISFADPHPLILLESSRFKNSGEGVGWISHISKSFICNTYGPPRKCRKHRTYRGIRLLLSPLDTTLTKRGRGVLNSFDVR